MASNHTENYGLNQWEAGDAVLRRDFNADNAKIDAALASLQSGKADITAAARIITGDYWGNGETSRTIVLPFYPKFLWIQMLNGGEDNHLFFISGSGFFSQPSRSPTVLGNMSDGRSYYIMDNILTMSVSTASLSTAERARIALNADGKPYVYVGIG